MVMAAPVVSPGPVVRVVRAVTAMWVWPGRSRVRSVKTVVMPVTVPPVVPVVVVESVVRQADPPVTPVRTRPAVTAARAVTAATEVPAVRVLVGLTQPVRALPVVTAAKAATGPRVAVVVRVVPVVSR